MRSIEILTAYFLLAWGLLLSLPFSTFETSVAYDFLSVIMPEWLWAIVSLGLAAFHLLSIRNESVKGRKLALRLAFICWLFISVSFFISLPKATACYTYLGIAILCRIQERTVKVGDYLE